MAAHAGQGCRPRLGSGAMQAGPNPYAYLQPFVAWEQAFTPTELDAIVAMGDALPLKNAAVVYEPGQAVENNALRISRAAAVPRDAGTGWLYDRIERVARFLNEQVYKFELTGFADLFQYTVYHASEGGHFDWHIDQIPNGAHRKLSLSLQLSHPADYDGCELELHGGTRPRQAPRDRGALIAFPSYAMHRVTPIRRGIRRALVIWTGGPPFR